MRAILCTVAREDGALYVGRAHKLKLAKVSVGCEVRRERRSDSGDQFVE